MSPVLEPTPQNALVWLDFEDQYSYTGFVQLLVDGDMEASGTTAWTSYGGTQAKVSASPRAGQAYRVTAAGTTTIGFYQGACVAGQIYRLTGWARSSGVTPPKVMTGLTTTLWTGIASSTWQYFDVTTTVDDVNIIYLSNVPVQSGEWMEFDDLKISLATAQQTKNSGLSTGAYYGAQLGDGRTSTTYPTQLSDRRGMSFDGGDYVNTGLIDKFNLLTPFTIMNVVSGFPGLWICTVWSTLNATTNTGATLYWDGSVDLFRIILASSTGNYYLMSPPFATAKWRQINSVCVAYAGGSASGINFYINGVLATTAVSTVGSPTTSMISNKPLYFGSKDNSAGEYWKGYMYHASVFPFCLNATQVAAHHNRIMKTINII